MNQASRCMIFRSIHIVFAIPIISYIYSRLTRLQTTLDLLGLFSFPCWLFQDLDVERSCRSAACLEKIGGRHRFVIEPMIFRSAVSNYGCRLRWA
jgi:hypothetical protein